MSKKNRFAGFYTFLLCCTGFLFSCDKESLEAPNPSYANVDTVELTKIVKKDFLHKERTFKLKENLNGDLTLNLEPNWWVVKNEKKSDSVSCIYVPLDPKFVSVKAGSYHRLKGVRYFLVVEIQKNEITYKKATYIFKNIDDDPGYNSYPFNFINRFTGVILLTDLHLLTVTASLYKNGAEQKVVENFQKPENEGHESNYASAICVDDWVCDWEKFDCYLQQWMHTKTYGQFGCGFPDEQYSCGNWSQIQTTITPQCYDDGGGDDGGGGGGGGDGGGVGSLVYQLFDPTKPLVLLNPCPGLTNAWLPLIVKTPSLVVANRLGTLTNQQANAVYNSGAAQVLPIALADGTSINLDYFAVSIGKMPLGFANTNDFLEYVRLHLNDFIPDVQTRFYPYPLLTGEENRWRSNPEGSILTIDIPGDDGSVITSTYEPNKWVFTTIHDPFNGNHPVSGNREFGITPNPNMKVGGHIFYIRGADRITTFGYELLGQVLGLSASTPLQFAKADELWQAMQKGVAAYVNSNGGNAIVRSPIVNRPNWSDVQYALDNGMSLSTVPCD